MMPRNLVYIRHGESQRNLAGTIAQQGGDMSLFEEVINRPSAVALLSEEGAKQAVTTGEWLRKQPFKFGRKYTSSYNRAKQTAGLLGLEGDWIIDNNLRERSGGVLENMNPPQRHEYLDGIRNKAHLFDAFNFRPDRGESYSDITIRKLLFFDTLHRECSNDDVLVVNHGDNMWVVEYLIRDWTPEEFVAIRADGGGKIPNGMVVHYTRINPVTGEESTTLDWVRTCCPWQSPIPSEWTKIERKRYDSQALLDQVKLSHEGTQVPQEKRKHLFIGH